MALATVAINEYNTVSETETAGITNSNLVSTDAANQTAATYPVRAGEFSYEKWQKIDVTAINDATKIDNLKWWYTGSLSGSDVLKSNARTTSYGGAEVFATPVTTESTIADVAAPTSEPASANLGIGGALDGYLDDAGSSDYLVVQLKVDSATTAGASLTFHYQYDETQ